MSAKGHATTSAPVDPALEAGLAALRARFRAGLEDRIIRLEGAAMILRQDAQAVEALAAIRDECHRIAGVAPSLGLADIGEIAMRIDAAFAERRASWPALEAPLERLLAALEGLLD
ncbi:MAG: hypothetical protein EP307_11180 [Rhodobacteraceae bacterium]|nr:MAG: hypothetical protein EP307_11180 [Paracoccaceae bacterium]